MREVLHADYVKFARASGVSEARILFGPRDEEHPQSRS